MRHPGGIGVYHMINKSDNNPGSSPAGPEQTGADVGPKRTYAVGFGKPPKASQFKKGVSGNPKGRQKAAMISDVTPVIEGIFSEPVKIREGEGTRTVSTMEAAFHAQMVLALKGEPKAIRTVFQLGMKAGLFSKAQQKSFIEIVEPDGEAGKILRGYYAEKKQQTATTGAMASARSTVIGSGKDC